MHGFPQPPNPPEELDELEEELEELEDPPPLTEALDSVFDYERVLPPFPLLELELPELAELEEPPNPPLA